MWAIINILVILVGYLFIDKWWKERLYTKIAGIYDGQIKGLEKRNDLLNLTCDELREQIENRDIIIGSLRDGFKGTKRHSEILEAEEQMREERDEMVERYDKARERLGFFDNDY